MADDERLREALLELQFLRDREANSLRETQALVECLEAYSNAPDPHQALLSVFRSLHNNVGSDKTILVKKLENTVCQIIAAEDPKDIGVLIETPTDIFARTRNLLDFHQLGMWQSKISLEGFKGAIIVPATAKEALIAFRKKPSSFKRADTALTQRLAGLAVQAFQNIKIAAERDRAQDRMTQALGATEDAFLVLDEANVITFANSAVGKLFPAQKSSWQIGQSFEQNWKNYLEEAKDLPGRLTDILKRPNLQALSELSAGQEIDLPDGTSVLLRASAVGDGGLVISATDITAMKSAQHLLSQRLAAIEAASDGIVVTDQEGRLIYQNSSAAQLLGFKSTASGLGQNWQSRYKGTGRIDPTVAFETNLTRKQLDKNAVHEISGSPIETGGAVIVIRDISEDLETEAREAEMMRELVRLQRQEAIAQLTAGVAHDFNNLLSTINGSVTLIGMTEELSEDAQKHLDRISTAGSQSAKLISRLLDIGADSEAEGSFSLASAVKDIPTLLGSNLPSRIDFNMDQDFPALALKGSPGTLGQILINMILNSADAIGGMSGKITLTLSEVTGKSVDSVIVGHLNPTDQYACIKVSDTGEGMDMDTAASVFKPYFSTKGRQGTGLGLATAAMQVQSVGGGIDLRTAQGEGATFSIYWPLTKVLEAQLGYDDVGTRDLSDMTLIIVDDDPNVSEVLGGFLTACGAEVAICEDPRDAIEAIEEDPNSWSALITDYDMPIMNGGELVSNIRSTAPELPIFVVTALAKRLSDPRIMDGQVNGIFAKPLQLEALTQALAATKTNG